MVMMLKDLGRSTSSKDDGGNNQNALHTSKTENTADVSTLTELLNTSGGGSNSSKPGNSASMLKLIAHHFP
jgi:hypothetical protein